MSCKKKEATDSKQPQKYIEPTFISFDNFQNRYKAIPKSGRIEKIRKNPNMIIESNDKQINCQSDEYDTNDNNEQKQGDKPDAIFQLVRPDWKQYYC